MTLRTTLAAAGALLGLAVFFLPPPAGADTDTMRVAGVVIVTLALWATAAVPEYFTSVLFFLFALSLTGLEAETVLIGNATPRDSVTCERLLRRVEGVLTAERHSLLEYNCPADRVEDAVRVTPGFSSPTINRLQDEHWVSVKVLVERDRVQAAMDELEALGCVAILETELRHARL